MIGSLEKTSERKYMTQVRFRIYVDTYNRVNFENGYVVLEIISPKEEIAL